MSIAFVTTYPYLRCLRRGGGGTVRCPWCGHSEDKVIDSRTADGGESIRRRRQCLHCGRRFTTFERVEGAGLTVVKRDGGKEPFDKSKVMAGVQRAIKNRPVTDDQVVALAKRTGATVISNFEIMNWLQSQGITKTHPMNTGGAYSFSFGRVKMTIPPCQALQHHAA